jgi:hypothetical protein
VLMNALAENAIAVATARAARGNRVAQIESFMFNLLRYGNRTASACAFDVRADAGPGDWSAGVD